MRERVCRMLWGHWRCCSSHAFGLKTTSSVARSAFSFLPGINLGPYAAASTQVLSAHCANGADFRMVRFSVLRSYQRDHSIGAAFSHLETISPSRLLCLGGPARTLFVAVLSMACRLSSPSRATRTACCLTQPDNDQGFPLCARSKVRRAGN